ncbi:hypothetical protein C8R48DRAFT_760633 [Suillus tomentosus]|nr:hypothetical protein C8R48DRAFT_760633 [Suillus tomentosus]
MIGNSEVRRVEGVKEEGKAGAGLTRTRSLGSLETTWSIPFESPQPLSLEQPGRQQALHKFYTCWADMLQHWKILPFNLIARQRAIMFFSPRSPAMKPVGAFLVGYAIFSSFSKEVSLEIRPSLRNALLRRTCTVWKIPHRDTDGIVQASSIQRLTIIAIIRVRSVSALIQHAMHTPSFSIDSDLT